MPVFIAVPSILASKWETHLAYFIFKTINVKSLIVLIFLASIFSRVKYVNTRSVDQTSCLELRN